MFSASDGDIEAVKTLLDCGADPDTVDDAGRNAIGLARHNRHSDIVKLLEKN